MPGRTRAMLFLEQNHYVGVAPVPLAQYQRYMAAFKAAAPHQVTRAEVRKAFSHLVISERVMDQLGPAVNAGHSMFVYGPPGNGKTVISQAIHNLLEGDILHSARARGRGQHHPLLRPGEPRAAARERSTRASTSATTAIAAGSAAGGPMVMVGGELSLDQLELSYSPTLGFYRAPVQALANGGVLVIDDFGRQSCSPRDLLNRWIVPLESRVDFLTLQTGQKFDFPFMTLIVFATNIKPEELVDEAFLRRIHYKIFAESPSRAEFLQIFENTCARARARVPAGRRRVAADRLFQARGRSSCAAATRAT